MRLNSVRCKPFEHFWLICHAAWAAAKALRDGGFGQPRDASNSPRLGRGARAGIELLQALLDLDRSSGYAGFEVALGLVADLNTKGVFGVEVGGYH